MAKLWSDLQIQVRHFFSKSPVEHQVIPMAGDMAQREEVLAKPGQAY